MGRHSQASAVGNTSRQLGFHSRHCITAPQAVGHGEATIPGPLTASAALVWSGDLPRPLQQVLFETADSLTTQPSPPPAELASLITA